MNVLVLIDAAALVAASIGFHLAFQQMAIRRGLKAAPARSPAARKLDMQRRRGS
jgi:hypothetical protein